LSIWKVVRPEELNVHDIAVNQMETAGKSAEFDAIKLEIYKAFERKFGSRATPLTIACFQAPINHITLGRMERSMEYRN